MKSFGKLLTLTWVLTIFSVTLSAQNYLPASVTFHSGKTQTGKIFYGNWGETPQSVTFSDDEGKGTRLGIKEIKTFEVTRQDGKKEHYVLKTVLVNRSSRKLSELEFGPQPKMVLDTVFLQLLLAADLKLYNLNQSAVNHLFVEKDSLYELIHNSFRTEVDGVRKYSENNRYRQQLLALTQRAPSLKKRILKLPYTETAIRRLLIDFFSRQGTPIQYEFIPERKPVDVFFSLGMVQNKFTYVGITDQAKLLKKTYSYAITNTPTPAVGAVLYFPKTHNRIGVAADVSFRNIRDSVIYNPKTYLPYINRQVIESQDFRLSHVRVHGGPRFQFSIHGIRAFVQPGATFGHIISNKSRETARVVDFLTSTYTVVERPIFNNRIKKQEFGLACTLGLGFKRWGIEARYDRGNGFSPYFDTAIKTYNYSLFVSYRLY